MRCNDLLSSRFVSTGELESATYNLNSCYPPTMARSVPSGRHHETRPPCLVTPSGPSLSSVVEVSTGCVRLSSSSQA